MNKEGTLTGKKSVRIIVLITTYNRPELLLDLLKSIKRELSCFRVKIYNDGSTLNYQKVTDYLRDNIDDYYYVKMPHGGKRGFWKLHQVMYREMMDEKYEYFVQTLDDMLFVGDFEKKAISQFHECGAELLNIIHPEGLIDYMTREGYKSEKINGNIYWGRPWLDLCFITTKRYLERMNYTCPKVSDQWFNRKKHTSSGVSTAITREYVKRGGTIMIVDRSLLIHTGEVSQMNTYKVPYKSRL